MRAIIKLHLKENIQKGSFIIYGILGTLITLMVVFSLEFSVNGSEVTTDYAIYGVQWTILTVIAALAGVSFSMNVIANHRQGSKRELLRLHGLSIARQYLGIFIANVLVSSTMALILCLGMFAQILIRGLEIKLINIFISLSIYLLACASVTTFISLLSLILPATLVALLGIFITLMGSQRGVFLILAGNKGGLFGKTTGALLKILPPLDEFGELIRDVFMSEAVDYNKFFTCGLYIWLLLGITFIIIKVVSRNEG